MPTMREIRAAYPNPQSAGEVPWPDGAYCVGAAVCRFADPQNINGFPDRKDICTALMILNQHLPCTRAMELARRIIVANDTGRFNNAWTLVETALQEQIP